MSIKHNIALKIYGSKFLKKILRPLALFILSKERNKTNTVVYVKKDGTKIYNKKIKNVKIEFLGNASNNYIEIREPYSVGNLNITVEGNSNTFTLDYGAKIVRMTVAFGNETKVSIGKNFYVGGMTIQVTNSIGKKVEIGSNCMFSYGLVLRTSDAHTIYDMNTKKVLNPCDDVIIGNHVWIAAHAKIYKGAKIPDDCVVAAYSLVNKKFDKTNCLLAGMPAGIKKENINWNLCSSEQWDF